MSKLSLGATSHRAESPEIGRRKGPWGCVQGNPLTNVMSTGCSRLSVGASPSFPNPYLDEHTHGRVMLHGLFIVGGCMGRYTALPPRRRELEAGKEEQRHCHGCCGHLRKSSRVCDSEPGLS